MNAPRPYPRRVFLRRAGLSALAVSGGTSFLASCASGGSEDDGERSGGGQEQTSENPFGVDAADPLHVVIFNGGYGEKYATDVHEPLYKKAFPKATVKHSSTQEISTIQIGRAHV